MSTRLTAEQVWLFRVSGFVRLPDRLPAATVTALRAAVDAEIAAEREPVVRNDAGAVVRLSNLMERADVFAELATSDLVLGPVADLIGPDIVVLHNRHNHATLRLAAARDEGMHRDTPYWTRGLVTVLTYLEDSTAERGCTQLVPGSHLLPYAPGPDEVLGGRLADHVVRAEAPAGGMLAMDSLLWHGVGHNRTDRSRTTITIGYHASDPLVLEDQRYRTQVRGEHRYIGNRRD